MIWVQPRMFHTALRYPKLPVIGAVIWNVALILAVGALAHGWNDGEEWLEIPWQIDLLIALAGVFFVIPLVATARARNVHHIYVSRSEEHTSELQSLMRISYAVFCLKKKKILNKTDEANYT